MVNTYLNLSHDDMAITKVINNTISNFNSNMPESEFKRLIIELDNIYDGSLSEFDEDIICDFQNNLYRMYPKLVDRFVGDNTPMNGQTLGEHMYFIRGISL